MKVYVDVILPISVPNTYTYSVPPSFIEDIEIGKRVVVQFGSKKYYAALIKKIHFDEPVHYKAKDIEYILDEYPVVYEYQIKFWEWLSQYYLSKIGDVMNAALPAGLKLESISVIQINDRFEINLNACDTLNDKEKKVIDILTQKRKIKLEELKNIIPKSSIPKVIKSLSDKGLITFAEELLEKYKIKLVPYIQLNSIYHNEQKQKEIITQLEKRAFKQLEALLTYIQLSHQQPLVKKSILIERAGAAAVKSLIEKNIFIEQLLEESRLNTTHTQIQSINLTDKQKSALESIKQQWQTHSVCLLYGEVGSGKTEIYIELIKEQIEQQKQVLYLVPEIALTTQLIDRLKKIFGEQVYVYHSRFSVNERTEIWNKLLNYEVENNHPEKSLQAAKIILGPRSALFLPFKNLGLIIIDEEHDGSFKQRQKHPYYNARDAAIYLASVLYAKVLLGSATPSIETLYNCDIHKYGKVVLSEKYGKAVVYRKLIDIRRYYHQMKQQTLITPPLFEAIKNKLNKKEQILFFHNRRGYVPIIQCLVCGWIAKCKNCDVSLVYHKQHNLLICHYCGEISDVIRQCPACGSTNINYKGWGTQKIEEELKHLFPDASIARLDHDSTRSKYAYKRIIDDFEQQKTDILIGTQMITKGLDFKNVTLVVVLNADALLYFPDFRSFEKSYQLLYQLSGRAGRLEKDGEALVQTFQPEHPVLQMYLENDYNKLYQYVLQERKKFNYPPFTKLYELIIKSKDETEGLNAAQQLFNVLYPYFKEKILGPIKPYISKINNYYLHHILIKMPKNYSHIQTKEIIASSLSKIQTGKTIVDIIVDA